MAAQSRIEQGLSPTLEDPARLQALATIFGPYLEPAQEDEAA